MVGANQLESKWTSPGRLDQVRSTAQVHPKFRLDFLAQPHEIDWPSGLDSGEVRAALQVSFFLAKIVCRVSSSPGLFSNEKIEFPGECRFVSVLRHGRTGNRSAHNRWNPLKAKNDDSADGTSNDL